MDRLLRKILCIMRPALVVIFASALCVVTATNSATARPKFSPLTSQSATTLPLANPDFAHPREPHQLFFVQRTTNANTVVYTAKFDQNGALDRKTPVEVYWRRFAGKGHIKALRWYERVFGFGVHIRPVPKGNANDDDGYLVAFNALRSHPFELRQTAPFQATLWIHHKNRAFQMIYVYLDIDETGLFPKVTRLRLYTSDPETGLYMTHTIAVSGGAFRE